MIPKGQGPQQGKLPPFMFVSKIAKISNDKYYINIPKAMWPDVQQYQQTKMEKRKSSNNRLQENKYFQ
jgi:hypothetical protein